MVAVYVVRFDERWFDADDDGELRGKEGGRDVQDAARKEVD